MDNEFDIGFKAFDELTKSESIKNRNEATTRLQLIDKIFMECLQWSSKEMILEEHQDGGFIDYTFYAPGPCLIVEAKKEGDYFNIPETGQKQIIYSIRNLTRNLPNLKDAMDQACTYCQKHGVRFGAISNGHQMICFIANRLDGIPPLEGKALVFPSLDFMRDHFIDLWNALSKPAIESKKLAETLLGEVRVKIPPKLSNKIQNYPGSITRNIFQTDLQILSEIVFEDLIGDHELESEFLRKCYIQSGTLSKYSLQTRDILQARYKLLSETTDSPPTIIAASSNKGITPELLAKSISRRPILLLGDVGAGKTTFIRHLIKIEAPEVFSDSITIHLNLGTKGALSQDLRTFIANEIIVQLKEKNNIDVFERSLVLGVYNLDLKNFKKERNISRFINPTT